MVSQPFRDRRFSNQPARKLALLGLIVGGVVAATRPNGPSNSASRSIPVAPAPAPAPIATAEPAGLSRAVDLAVALPGDSVRMQLDLGTDSTGLRYEWVAVGDTVGSGAMLPFLGLPLLAPSNPGYYHLALLRDSQHVVLGEPMLAVMVPFQEKRGGRIDQYRIGTYPDERGGAASHPAGFLVVRQGDADLAVSSHLRLGEFISHDSQRGIWPKYLALDPRLLDKLELVVAELETRFRRSDGMQLQVEVRSGFRTPFYNRTVPRAADDSRHQFGDAADVTFDVNGDGRTTPADISAIVRAVDTVEARYPELVGGLGIYTSHRYLTPYVHIDTRGARIRWRG